MGKLAKRLVDVSPVPNADGLTYSVGGGVDGSSDSRVIWREIVIKRKTVDDSEIADFGRIKRDIVDALRVLLAFKAND